VFVKTILFVIACVATIVGCRSCPPAKDVMNGRASERHDRRKFRAVIYRIDGRHMWASAGYGRWYTGVSECWPVMQKIGDTVDVISWTEHFTKL